MRRRSPAARDDRRRECGPGAQAGVVSDVGLHPLPAGVRLLPPLAVPTVRDFVTFEEHVEGVTASVGNAADGGSAVVPEWYQAPTFYFTNPYALIGAYDDVPVPPGSEMLDFEL